MFKKLHDYLLTHYPLLWNTRIVWLISISFFIHLLFFLSGLAEVSAYSLKEYYSLEGVGGAGLYTFSILCSLAVIIIWLVFYLRNNAYKSYYIIDKYHSAKEFCIIVITILFAITFFESHHWGVWLKTRIITGQEQLVKEANVINLAKAFIPGSKQEYFKLNNCKENPGNIISYTEGHNYFDTSQYNYNDTNNIKIREALNDRDAFSYKNYCNEFIELGIYKNFIPADQWIATKNRWIDRRDLDSIKYILRECQAICKKYGVEQRINKEVLAQLVFADSFYNITRTFPYYSTTDYNTETDNIGHFNAYQLERALEFVDECRLDSNGDDSRMDIFTVEMYIALCLSILLLCYRLYSKRVFLISFVGTIVWAILFALFGVSSLNGVGLAWFYLFLFAIFLILAIILLRSNSNKTAAGVLLNWHVYMVPFVIMLIVFLINENYDRHLYAYTSNYSDIIVQHRVIQDTELKKRFPVGYWLNNNTALIIRLNLLFVFLYVAFSFTKLSKKWHIMPEE